MPDTKSRKPKPCYSNPLVEIYKGREVRKYNQIGIRVNSRTFKKIIDLFSDHNLSAKTILEASGRPCDKCKDIHVVVFNSDGAEIKIPRGILTKK